MLADEVAETVRKTSLLEVKTFHQLCEDLGREAGVQGPRPAPAPQSWFSETLPRALDDAIAKLGPRYQAIVVDEGQDFDAGWLRSLEGLLFGGREDGTATRRCGPHGVTAKPAGLFLMTRPPAPATSRQHLDRAQNQLPRLSSPAARPLS